MQAGARTELVAFERMVTSPDGAGGFEAPWIEIGRAWAAVQWISGDEGERDGGVRTRSRYRLTVPMAAAEELALTPVDRIVWNGDHLNIRERPRRITGTADIELIADMGVAQ